MSKQKIKNSQDGDTEEKEKESIGTKLLDELKNWDEGFTMHGFKNIMKAEYMITRIIWILLTKGMVVYSIYCK
jgi:hypothetical protein